MDRPLFRGVALCPKLREVFQQDLNTSEQMYFYWAGGAPDFGECNAESFVSVLLQMSMWREGKAIFGLS